MVMRLQELHPALVHLPITMLPVSLVADGIGALTGDGSLLDAGRTGIVVAAGGALLASVAGIIAQETSEFDQDSRDVLVTHRTLNLGLVGLLAGMAMHRRRHRSPGAAYFAAGAAGLGLMTYSAYLGGVMVYQQGIGVEGRGKLRRHDAPHLVTERATEIARITAAHLRRGTRDAAKALANGELIPALTGRHSRERRATPSVERQAVQTTP